MTHTADAESIYDLLVIGGGINGVGIAADAAGRGLKVALCEKHDLGAATSSASSKLIHGGLRYLEHYDFGLVRKSLIEQNRLLHNAPHLIQPQAFILPHCPWLRPYWMIRLGLFMYDHLSWHRLVPKSQSIKFAYDDCGLQAQFKRGFQYFDCKTDDSRLVCHVALLASLHGATILPRHEVLNTKRSNEMWDISANNLHVNKEIKFKAKCIINVAGPWVDKVAEKVLSVKPRFKVQLVKGSHIVVPKLTENTAAYLLQNKDERITFVIPYQQKYHLIGTTDVPVSDTNDLKVNDEEKQYLCNAVNQFMKKNISPTDIVNEYWGYRALQAGEQKAQKLSRDYMIDIHDDLAPCIHILGGKLTTYRALSEEVVNQLKRFFPALSSPWTAHAKLPGADFHSLSNLQLQLQKQYEWLPESLITHLVRNYGSRSFDILNDAHSLDDLGPPIGEALYAREVDYLVQNEWAHDIDDILWRRTKFGLYFSQQQQSKLQDYLNSISR